MLTAATRLTARLTTRAHRWATRHPQLTKRLTAAIGLAPLVREGAPDRRGWHYTVPSDSTAGIHAVLVYSRIDGSFASSCDCEDRPRKGWQGIFRCKHRLAVALACTEGLVEMPVVSSEAAE